MNVASAVIRQHGDARSQSMSRFLGMIFDEAAEEMANSDPVKMAEFMHHFALTFEWVATGDYSVLPPALLEAALSVSGFDDEQIREAMCQYEEARLQDEQDSPVVSGQDAEEFRRLTEIKAIGA